MAALAGLVGDYGTDDESMATGREGTGTNKQGSGTTQAIP